tara:strand:+ start:74 stop:208 length:135 start_codon:yes stop_codon:yes gene_type:complete
LQLVEVLVGQEIQLQAKVVVALVLAVGEQVLVQDLVVILQVLPL